MVRSYVKQSLIKPLNEYLEPIHVDERTFFEVEGNDVTFFNWIIDRWTTNDKVPYHYDDRLVDGQVRDYEARGRELKSEYDDLVHELKWCFNPIREWKIYGRLKELKIELADRRPSSEIRRELEEHVWYEPKKVEHEERYYQARMIWHVDCTHAPTFEPIVDGIHLSDLRHLPMTDQVNWSILNAMVIEPMDKKIKAVQAVIESYQKNHHDKGDWKIFLDAAREGKQLKFVASTFEDLLTN